MSDIKAIRAMAERPEDLHQCLDEAISRGVSGAVLICRYADSEDPNAPVWEAWSTEGFNETERVYIYNALIFHAVHDHAIG